MADGTMFGFAWYVHFSTTGKYSNHDGVLVGSGGGVLVGDGIVGNGGGVFVGVWPCMLGNVGNIIVAIKIKTKTIINNFAFIYSTPIRPFLHRRNSAAHKNQ